jgi:phage FluMu protein Com
MPLRILCKKCNTILLETPNLVYIQELVQGCPTCERQINQQDRATMGVKITAVRILERVKS